MEKINFTEQAFNECCSAEFTPHPTGKTTKPFWNTSSYQFMYVPAFQFNELPGTKIYRYRAVDEKNVEHVFEADNCRALLTPIWAEIPEGVVNLRVYALDREGNEKYLIGARTFFRLAPFEEGLVPEVPSFKAAAMKAYDCSFEQPFIKHWFTDGTPDPDSDRYVYPSKMIAAIIDSMIELSVLCPERKEQAMKLATITADYLLASTPKTGHPMYGIPPTYKIDFRSNPETRNNLKAGERINTVMMIYPATVCRAYLHLEAATGDVKYFEAAKLIGEYFKKTVEENGSWCLIRDYRTGEKLTPNYCLPIQEIAPMCMEMYARTGDEAYKKMADGAVAYMEKTVLHDFNFEAQFEDMTVSTHYSNLSHYGASALARFYCNFYSDNEEKMAVADDLARYIEDQFCIWKRPAPFTRTQFDPSDYPTPCGLEQYDWHVPIDASTSDMVRTFMAMHKAGRGELYLEKAKTMAAAIVKMQLPNGLIPTHWMTPKHRAGAGFWPNCMFFATGVLSQLSAYLKEN